MIDLLGYAKQFLLLISWFLVPKDCMLQRADDRKEDDGVRDLIHDCFHTLWFNGKSFERGKSSLSLVADDRGKSMTKAQLYSREAAKAMVEVVRMSGR